MDSYAERAEGTLRKVYIMTVLLMASTLKLPRTAGSIQRADWTVRLTYMCRIFSPELRSKTNRLSAE